MNNILSNSLFKRDKRSFDDLRTRVKEFVAVYIGGNIIQDDIFGVIMNYAQRKHIPLQVLRYPISDDDVCAFTTQIEDMVFINVNSVLPISKQIFAAAHELYHLLRYVVDKKDDMMGGESLLTAKEIDEEATEKEDVEANAFAGLLLVTSSSLSEQIDVYGIDRNQIRLSDVIRMMDVFAVPYKAIVLRLYEEKYIDEKKARKMLEIRADEIERQMQRTNLALRWQKKPRDVDLGGLREMLRLADADELLPKSRIDEDNAWLDRAIRQFEDQ